MIEPICGLDENFNLVKYINFISLEWHRKYYEAGKFIIYMKYDEWSDNIKYISRCDRNEIGVVNKPLYEQKIEGDFYTVYGSFLESILNKKIIYPDYFSVGAQNITTICQNLVTTYKDNSLIVLDGAQASLGTNITKQETNGDKLGDILYDTLKTQELSYKTVWNGTNIVFTVWQGKDRTQSQSTNTLIIFSNGFRTISNVKYSLDDSNYKNFAYVKGTERFTIPEFLEEDWIEEADIRAVGEEKRAVFLDSGMMVSDPGMSSHINFLESLIQYGIEKLQNYKMVENLTFDVVPNKYVYMTDYDLGDKCDIIVDNINKSYESRIIEIIETYEQNKESLNLVMGDKIPTPTEKARLK